MVNELGNENIQHDIVQNIAQCLSGASCENVNVYNVENIYDYVDFCIIATVRSEVQKRGIVERLAHFFFEQRQDFYSQQCRIKVKAQKHEQGWLLIDLYDIIIHLMNEDTRGFYQLEKLWFNAQRIFFAENKHVSVPCVDS